MSEDSTRKLLKLFGVAMTDCEDALAALITALREPPGTPGASVGALEAYGRAARQLSERWTEVSRLVLDYQLRAQQAVESHLRGAGG